MNSLSPIYCSSFSPRFPWLIFLRGDGGNQRIDPSNYERPSLLVIRRGFAVTPAVIEPETKDIAVNVVLFVFIVGVGISPTRFKLIGNSVALPSFRF